MTERGRNQSQRSRDCFIIGPSQLHWDGSCLTIDLDEWSNPIPRRVQGRVRLYPDALFTAVMPLDPLARHRWGPIAPAARIEVDLHHPALRWQGNAYFDANEGDEAIHLPFADWDWSRSRLADGSTAVLYDLRLKDGSQRLLALRFRPDGSINEFAAAERQRLPDTLWRIRRQMRSESPAQVLETLEDTPFYQRALLSAQVCGEPTTTFHESLDLRRLDRTSTRLMLPWRMPRLA